MLYQTIPPNLLLLNKVHAPTSQWYSNIALSVVFADSSFQHTFKVWRLLLLKKEIAREKWSIKLIRNNWYWAVSAQHWRKQRLLAALGRALLKLLSRHKLLVSDQVLCLQCKVCSSLVLLLRCGMFLSWSELEAAVSGGKFCSVTLHTGERDKKISLICHRFRDVLWIFDRKDPLPNYKQKG